MDKMKKMLKKRGLRRVGGKRGFTLVELLIVMTIIAVLVGIVVMSLIGFLGAGEETVCQADQRSLQTAVIAFWVLNGGSATDWPTEAGTIPAATEGAAIDYTKGLDSDGDGTIDDDEKFVPGYVLEKPRTEPGAGWWIGDDAIVVSTGAECLAQAAEATPEP